MQPEAFLNNTLFNFLPHSGLTTAVAARKEVPSSLSSQSTRLHHTVSNVLRTGSLWSRSMETWSLLANWLQGWFHYGHWGGWLFQCSFLLPFSSSLPVSTSRPPFRGTPIVLGPALLALVYHNGILKALPSPMLTLQGGRYQGFITQILGANSPHHSQTSLIK